MKTKLLFLIMIVSAFSLQGQIIVQNGGWSAIGDTNLSNVTSDGDNGDGVNDGAIFVDGTTENDPQGTRFVLGGTMNTGEVINFETYTYNPGNAFVRFNVEFYNETDGVVLAVMNETLPASEPSRLTSLNYTALSSDEGDVLVIRYIRTNAFNTFRNFAIDNAAFNGTSLDLNLSVPSGLTLDGQWFAVGDTSISNVTTDGDNGDGVNDGAIFVDGTTENDAQGTRFVLGGTMNTGEVINFETYTYNPGNAFVRFNVELYNETDGVVLAVMNETLPASEPSRLTSLNYTALSSDEGDVLVIRYIRTNAFNTFRNFAIDNASLNEEPLSLEIAVESGLISGLWGSIGDTKASVTLDDPDGGDGVNDGALYVDGITENQPQGIGHTLGGSMNEGEFITVTTTTYNPRTSFVRFNVELYNVTDNVVLASINELLRPTDPPRLTTINYTALASDDGDVLAIRYIRTNAFNTFRDFGIDNASLNGEEIELKLPLTGPGTPCFLEIEPDLPLLPSNVGIEEDIQSAFQKYSDNYLGTVEPSEEEFQGADLQYEELGIELVNGEISGVVIESFTQMEYDFLKTYATHLKFNPNDEVVKEKVNNTVRWFSTLFCQGVLNLDGNMYSYEEFARPTLFMQNSLSKENQKLFIYNFAAHINRGADVYWEPNYDAEFQREFDGINTDLVYNLGDALLAYVTWQETPEERYRYMRGYKRFMERFFSYSYGTANGIKKDGTGFHHWTAYDHYMYAYNTAGAILEYLDNTDFQVSLDSYLRFRDVIYTQFIISNDNSNKPLSLSGRIVTNRKVSHNLKSVKKIAIAGGNILGLSTPDPVLGGLYNQRIEEPDANFNYSTITPLTELEGFYQFNHGHMGVYRRENWVAVNKGFSNNMWGTEIFPSQNRYGRYQSYGALEILYPGDEENGLGFDLDTWNWNYNPGATTIVLPWEKLHAERGRLDELQQKRFVGSLSFANKESETLSMTHGTFGMFAMDFQEREGLGFSTIFSGNNHNNTFRFKKSSFMFDDFIISLGSGIYNNDTDNPTVTTLFQRLDNTGKLVEVNGVPQSGATNDFSSDEAYKVVSNFDTGFYVTSNSGKLKIVKGVQQTPNQNQTNPLDYLNNSKADYYLGYLDHGVNPQNAGYEYVIAPNINGRKKKRKSVPHYKVRQKDSSAHILSYGEQKKYWGYAFFQSGSPETEFGIVDSINSPALVMYQALNKKNGSTKVNGNSDNVGRIRLTLTNPDVGFEFRKYDASIEKNIVLAFRGQWELETPNADIVILSTTGTETLISFKTVDGLPVESVFTHIDYVDKKKPKVPKNDEENDETTIIYPNPTYGAFKLNTKKFNFEKASVVILDMQGTVVQSFKNISLPEMDIDISEQPKGLYVLYIYKNSKVVEAFKIIKK